MIRVAFDPNGVNLPGTDVHALTGINENENGPIRFSTVGVSFAVGNERGFAPWASVSGVVGWEPLAGEVKEAKK